MEKTVVIGDLAPHYTDDYYRKPRTVWVTDGYQIDPKSGYDNPDSIKGADYNYSDRLFQWNYTKARESWEYVKSQGIDSRTAEGIELYLRRYFDNEAIELVHVLAGHNLSTGYPYQIYGYKGGQS